MAAVIIVLVAVALVAAAAGSLLAARVSATGAEATAFDKTLATIYAVLGFTLVASAGYFLVAALT